MTLDPRTPRRPDRTASIGDLSKQLDRIETRLSRIEGGLMLGGFLLVVATAILGPILGRI